MNAIYVEDMSKSYMILSEEQQSELDYQVQMLEKNEIPGLLSVRVKQVDCQLQYHYEISGKRQLAKWLEENKLNYNQVRKLIQSFSDIIVQLEDYLLSEQCLMLDGEYIYIETETWDVYFCYYPPNKEKNRDGFQSLLQLILKKMDHKDPEAVFLSYRLFQESLNDSISLKRIQKILNQKEPEEWKFHRKPEDSSLKEHSKEIVEEKQPEELSDIPLKRTISDETTHWNVPEQLGVEKNEEKIENSYEKEGKYNAFFSHKKKITAEKIWMAVPFLTLFMVIVIFSGKIIPIQKVWAKYPWICMGILLFALGSNFIIIKRWYFNEEE